MQTYIPYSILNIFRFDGVMVFFVLSGFLIGQILIRTYEKVPDFNFKVLLNFWKRRWLRTLPLYFVVLFIFYVVHIIAGNKEVVNLIAFSTFTQNLASIHPNFFKVAWSLSVEEWFYLITPILLFVFAFLPGAKKIKILLVIAMVLIFSLLMRYLELLNYEVIEVKIVQPIIRKVVIFRLDSIMLGVLMAYFKIYHFYTWKKHVYALLVLGILSLAFIKLYPLMRHQPYLHYLTGGNLLAFATMCFLPYLDNLKPTKLKIHHKAFIHISLISYSLYLTHPLVYIATDYLGNVPPILKFVLMWIGSILLATLFYVGFEKPILLWRDKVFPDKYKKL